MRKCENNSNQNLVSAALWIIFIVIMLGVVILEPDAGGLFDRPVFGGGK